jgi:hypothetical protein
MRGIIYFRFHGTGEPKVAHCTTYDPTGYDEYLGCLRIDVFICGPGETLQETELVILQDIHTLYETHGTNMICEKKFF